MRTSLVSFAVVALSCATSYAGFRLDIDFDPGTAGIQSTVTAADGATVTGQVLLTLSGTDATNGFGGYQFDLAYDNTELGTAVVTRQTIFGSSFFTDNGTNQTTFWGTVADIATAPEVITGTTPVQLATFSFVVSTAATDGADLSFSNPLGSDAGGAPMTLDGLGTGTINAVPEPSSALALLAVGSCLALRRRRSA